MSKKNRVKKTDIEEKDLFNPAETENTEGETTDVEEPSSVEGKDEAVKQTSISTSKEMLSEVEKSAHYKVEKTEEGYGVFTTNDELIREYKKEDVEDPKAAAISFCYKLVKKLKEANVIPVIIK